MKCERNAQEMKIRLTNFPTTVEIQNNNNKHVNKPTLFASMVSELALTRIYVSYFHLNILFSITYNF